MSWDGSFLKDADGNFVLDANGRRQLDERTSDRSMLKKCSDFQNEKSQLQHILEDKLGCLCIFTPKCHPEIAGRGIEYAWGYSKMRFRGGEFNDAKGKNLERNVTACLSQEVLNLQRMRKFAREGT